MNKSPVLIFYHIPYAEGHEFRIRLLRNKNSPRDNYRRHLSGDCLELNYFHSLDNHPTTIYSMIGDLNGELLSLRCARTIEELWGTPRGFKPSRLNLRIYKNLLADLVSMLQQIAM